MKRTWIGGMFVAVCAVTCFAPSVTGQQQAALTSQQPGTRLSLDALKRQMFRVSAGRRLK